jgi:ATP-dependent helicase/nuclease subunit B
VRISFLLGPAGSGKTHRCLEAIRQGLAKAPEGAPLILLAPKQATFQLERQLLEGASLRGYTRLELLSFERLARFVLEACGAPRPRLISDEGRTMVLRAILNGLEGRFAVFGAAARRHGFAEELGAHFREFANHGLTPSRLRELAAEVPNRQALREKLRDFATVFESYRAWLKQEDLQDGDALLGAAADALEKAQLNFPRIGGVWLDGFAQLTPEERRLLVALLKYCDQATLAFCVETEEAPRSSLSPWHLVSQTMAKCRVAIEVRYKKAVTFERLGREFFFTRFSGAPVLAHLEAAWSRAEAPAQAPECGEALRLVECADPEAEAVWAAREILQFVWSGGRFREAAVLARNFQNDYPHILRRVFRRYGIPYFIDHREGVAHHPLAELTRGALRTAAFDWQQRDWFTTLKCGLIPLPPEELDRLENEAMARGWTGAAWREGFRLPRAQALEAALNERREKLMPPFLELARALGGRPAGPELAEAVRALWRALEVQEQLDRWTKESPEDAVHATVWEQMNAWLENLELAFAGQHLSLRQWLPIIDAGLSSLTVGVIPPVLDEVLIGAVDRSRNPDLRLLCIVGFNERVFPAVPGRESLLTEDDRTMLLNTGTDLAESPALKLAAEQFYG